MFFFLDLGEYNFRFRRVILFIMPIDTPANYQMETYGC